MQNFLNYLFIRYEIPTAIEDCLGLREKCSKLLHNICAQYCFGHFLLEILEILKLLQIGIRECWSVGVDFKQTKHLLTRRGLIV